MYWLGFAGGLGGDEARTSCVSRKPGEGLREMLLLEAASSKVDSGWVDDGEEGVVVCVF
jgi:hypothetical protein